MVLVIENITPANQSDQLPDKYHVRVNNNAPLAYFTHRRSHGAAACLRAAADAIDKASVERDRQLIAKLVRS